jgi:hypothetical protein
MHPCSASRSSRVFAALCTVAADKDTVLRRRQGMMQMMMDPMSPPTSNTQN